MEEKTYFTWKCKGFAVQQKEDDTGLYVEVVIPSAPVPSVHLIPVNNMEKMRSVFFSEIGKLCFYQPSLNEDRRRKASG